MAADVNGFPWGYSEAFYENGIHNFFTCVHTHHGMFPLFQKQLPFYWETPKGNKILVWSGDHYHTGNRLGFCPNIKPIYQEDGSHYTKAAFTSTDLETTKKLLDEYIAVIKKQNYTYDFIPIMISGLFVDNAPPNGHIVEYIQAFNQKYKKDYQVEMCSLDEFFTNFRILL